MIYLLKDSFSAVSNLFRAHQWRYLCIEFFFFISSISSFCFCFSLGFSFLFLYRPSVLAWCLIYSLESLAFFKNFLSDYSNIPAMSVSDACSGSSNCVFGLWVCRVMCSSQLDIMCQIKETMVNRPSVLSCWDGGWAGEAFFSLWLGLCFLVNLRLYTVNFTVPD